MSEVLLDEARGSRRASRLEQIGPRMVKTLVIIFMCVGYGFAYGAGAGATCGAIFGILFPLIGPVNGFVGGAYAGALCGTIGGGIFGIVGSIIPGRAGWIPAGLLAGMIFPAWYWRFSAEAFWHPLLILIAMMSVFLGGILGLALNLALRRGNSMVPGVQRLAAIILDRDWPPEGLGNDAEPDEGRSAHEA
jgi:hypothetical protein